MQLLEEREAELTARWERALEASQAGFAATRHSLQEEIPIGLLLSFCLLYAASCYAQTELSHRPSSPSPALQGERGTLQQALDLANRQLAAAHRDMETLRLQVLFQSCAVQAIMQYVSLTRRLAMLFLWLAASHSNLGFRTLPRAPAGAAPASGRGQRPSARSSRRRSTVRRQHPQRRWQRLRPEAGGRGRQCWGGGWLSAGDSLPCGQPGRVCRPA